MVVDSGLGFTRRTNLIRDGNSSPYLIAVQFRGDRKVSKYGGTKRFATKRRGQTECLDLADRRASFGSKVKFRDEQTGKVQEIVLVYPLDADIARRRVSVLTPVGAALLGLSVKQMISFRTRTGERRELTVLKVGRED
ncbi:GreA/GreB family elongation factor [Bradyrhizobium ottawaense]|uniref:GreA/GreB family elongation factor n=1 Tax=Bradyrhizobium ottawaense TaxID=931866 RepID=UPI001FD9762B|nr:GreA/GreB family elongation factor [Bradyrhizobium ottawaense]